MNTIIKLGFAPFAMGALSTLPIKANTPDATFAFTKHGLPVPGAYFKARENQRVAAVAVSKTRKGARLLGRKRLRQLRQIKQTQR